MGANVKALVIGGTGPTGPLIIEGLRSRGFKVSVLNRGVHPIPMPDDVEQIVGDPHFAEPLEAALSGRTFDLVVATYGRLKVTSEVLAGRAGRFIAVGGAVVYRGFNNPAAMWPSGQHLPVRETSPLAEVETERFGALAVVAEETMLKHHPTATLFRYPYVYGPRQVTPREWSLVRRVLDGRRTIVVMDGGLALNSHMFANNAAHAIMLAVDKPDVAAGKLYNCADDEQFDQRQLIEIGARALGVELDVVSIPNIASAHGALIQANEYHRFVDSNLTREELGYRDLTPAAEAIAQTFRWYRDNPLERGGEYEQRRKDVFDYVSEDKLIELYRQFTAGIEAIEFKPRHENYADHPYAHPKEAATSRDQRGR